MDSAAMTRTPLSAALALCLSAGAVAAQELPAATLTIIDSSGDGILTSDEIDALVAILPAAMDTNEDGKVDAAEAAAVLTADQIAAIDTDADGVLSPDELAAVIRADLAAADVDGNGLID
jgi:hypothetical protein